MKQCGAVLVCNEGRHAAICEQCLDPSYITIHTHFKDFRWIMIRTVAKNVVDPECSGYAGEAHTKARIEGALD